MSTKEQVLYSLMEENNSVSGEKLARKLGVSRTAVWKAIVQLRNDGYRIEACTNRGYRLSELPDRITETEIRRWLKTSVLGSRIEIYPSLDSTNMRARTASVEGAPQGTLVIAESQTRGRGRFSRQFFSPPRTGIYMSLVLRPRVNAEQATGITTMAAVAVARAIETVADVKVQIKWVNDLLIHGRKVCGILCEGSMDFESKRMEAIILGIGINVGHMVFPKNLESIATSLEDECGAEVSRCRLIAEICNQLEALYPDREQKNYIREIRERSCVIGKTVTVYRGAENYQAKALDIDDDGRLLVETPEGIRALDSGEISLGLGEQTP